MEKLLITGGFGFIGKNLIEYFIDKYEIVVIDKFIDTEFANKYDKIKVYEYDFFKDNNINDILENEKPYYIINLISIVSAERNMEIFDDMIQVNLGILLKLYNASKNLNSLKFFLQFGSGEEYGNIDSPLNENNREYPNSPYSLSKQLTSNTAIMLNKNYGFPISVVRPGNLFGKYQGENKFIPYIINQLRNNKEIETTPGEQKRDFIYALDFSKGIELIIKNNNNFIGEIVNLSSGKSIRLKEIILFCKSYLDSNSEINFGKIPYRENEMMNFQLDIRKFKEKTKEEFENSLFDGLKDYINLSGGK
jgi:nucleoside-diphosphate-sugar epimerase